jgi:alanine racemase
MLVTGPVAQISESALAHNIDHLRRVVAPARLMVVLKADAYGHGALTVARIAQECGVADLGALDLETALRLRAEGVPESVRVLAWLYPPAQEFDDAVAAAIDLGVSRLSELERITRAVERARSSGTSSSVAWVHLKLDTGLHRNGATAEEWPSLLDGVSQAHASGLVRVRGVWSHIAEASEDEDTDALRRFEEGFALASARGFGPIDRHLAASSAGLRRQDVRLDMVRMGGHCWGIPSFDGVTPADIGLIPVMTLHAPVVAVRGDDGRAARVGIVAAGYGDGIPRSAAGRVDVAIGGRRHPVLDVDRDTLTVADHQQQLVGGEEAILFGRGADGEMTVREWGDATGTLGDEITARISARVPRILVE